jgi:O-antigen ligase
VAARDWVAPLGEAVLITSHLLLRTLDFDAPLLWWLVAAVVTALVSPTSGLVVLAAIAPLEDVFVDGFGLRAFGFKPLLLGAVLAGIVVRSVLDQRNLVRPRMPIILAGIVLAGTGAGLVVSWYRFGGQFARLAAYAWALGIATALVTFVCAAWVARRGQKRPMIVALGSAAAAGILSLVSYLAPEEFRASAFGWMAIAPLGERLVELARSPTSAAALIMVPATFLLAAAALGANLRLRLGALAASVPLLLVAYLTYTRTVYVALFATAVIVAWRIRRGLGLGVLVVGLALAIAIAPAYIRMRADALGGVATPRPGEQLIASDAQRINAWLTSIRMTMAAPLTGHGYRSYRQVGSQYGAEPAVNAPHNEWLRLFGENGIFTGLAGLGFAATTFAALARRRDWLGTAILCSFASIVLAACFNNPFLYNQVMIPSFVVAGTGLALARGAFRPP